jgi:hypothetical protein
LVLVLVGTLAAAKPDADQRVWPDWVRTLPELRDDPVRAQQVLLDATSTEPGRSDRTGRLPRVSALFLEWVWYADERWLDDAGAVLEAAAAPGQPDGAGSLIMEAVVTAVAEATHSPAAGGVPDRLRPTLGRLAVAYLPDVSMMVGEDDLDHVAAGTSLRQL